MKGDICKVEGCERIVTIDKSLICVMHRVRKVRYKSFELPERIKTPIDLNRRCKIEGCQNKAKRKNTICATHEKRRTRHGSYDLPEKPQLPEGILKSCPIHGMLTEKDVRIRIRLKKGRSNVGTSIQCKICENKVTEQWRKKNPEKVKLYASKMPKNRHLKKCYGITPEHYEYMSKRQNGLCAICHQPETIFDKKQKLKRNLSVDHCHLSESKGIMKVRGLLCHRCNSMIGLSRDSIEIHEEAIKYLLRHK